jgi:hypothetical protein
MTVPAGTMTPGYQVGFVTNLLERLYKDTDHRITLAENQTALKLDSTVATYTAKAIQTTGLLTTDADKATAAATQKLYDKKTNFDKTFATLFANDANGVTITDVRNIFGQNIDREVFAGKTLNQVIDMRTSFTQRGWGISTKNLDMWVHSQGSHEGDLVGVDGKRILGTSSLQAIDPVTGKAVETVAEAKARSAAATTNAAANNPVGGLANQAAFRAELNRELSGGMDKLFVESEVTGHKGKGDFIKNVLAGKLGATGVQDAVDANYTISTNATQFLKDFNTIGGGDPSINRVNASIFFNKKIQPQRNTSTPNAGQGDIFAQFQTMFNNFFQQFPNFRR